MVLVQDKCSETLIFISEIFIFRTIMELFLIVGINKEEFNFLMKKK